ncbi:short chain dehydrogenase domain-containing protein [Trichoderma breve]|uniref:Short chain dehydrogenase domain-containing protein n=1 Tax=Trichoderma breve TaxID=2034170 RepID=A0A9W9E771_9HYPO|nr:short chain dehydrogenase domain-containing protein [Trichoderma breve]KAJ4860075.1 short chain dehydrogenase domain-containing protein [Trichoderma breve]
MFASPSSKIVLVTGANQGIGFQIAKSLSSKPGYHVLVGSRDTQRGIKAAKDLQDQGLNAEPITIDVTSDNSIAEVVQQVKSKFGRLDVLINNAGVCLNDERTSPPSLRIFQDTFAVNTFGAALTTEAFIPLLTASSAPRVVFVSSFMGSLTHRPESPVPLPIYRSSKAALNMIMLHYALKYKDAGWKVNATCPGYCATNLNGFVGKDDPADGALNAVKLATMGEDGETGTFSNKEGSLAW